MASMDKILLLNPPGDRLYQRDAYCSAVSKAHYYWPSIDLLVLSGILGQEYEVEVMDAIIEKMSPDECLRRIMDGGYKAVVFLTGTASWRQDFEFLKEIKTNKQDQPLLIGNGDILLYEAEKFLSDYNFLDAILFDYTSSDVLDYLKGDFGLIGSMAFRNNGKVEIRRANVRAQEYSYPVPHHQKFPLKKYLLAQGKRFPFTTAQTSFGCPFRCSFCVASTLGFKYRSVDNILEELRYICSLGIKEVYLIDFTFESRRQNTLELCQRMVDEGLDLTWICSSRASTLDKELLTWMKKAGCHTILLGVESGDDEMLESYSKGVTKDQMREVFGLCRELGIRTLGHFIIGLPGETVETVKKTIDFSLELDCDIASFNVAVPALGTPLRETSLEQGWLDESVLEFDSSGSFPVIETPQFSKQQAWEWRKKAVRKFYFRPSYIWRTAFAARSLYQWKILVLNGLAIFWSIFKKR
jgi:radical SAM superfamily enzyme YgiQ (UPF0313 family)